MSNTPFFSAGDVKPAYQAHFHFAWKAYRHGAFPDSLHPTIESTLRSVAERQNYHLLDLEIDTSVVRALISLRPEDAPAEVTRFLKGNIATAVRNQHTISNLWSRGWFFRSVGHATNETVRDYVRSQYDDRNSPGGDVERSAAARYTNGASPRELRTSNHGAFEFNAHIVLVTHRRREVLDLEMARELIAYLRRVCETKAWVAWDIQFVWNHVHLFVGLSPGDSPGGAALSLLNNAEYFLQRRYGAMLARDVTSTIFQPGYYVGTVGSATTAQVKAYLAAR